MLSYPTVCKFAERNNKWQKKEGIQLNCMCVMGRNCQNTKDTLRNTLYHMREGFHFEVTKCQ